MNQSIARSERITALVSALVAVVILAAGVTAQQRRSTGDDQVKQLLSDLQFQLGTAFRRDVRERDRRLDQLQKTVDSWNASPQSEADRRLLRDWLTESIIRSMPGAIEPLPAIPGFGQEVIAAVQTPPPADEPPLMQQTHVTRKPESRPEAPRNIIAAVSPPAALPDPKQSDILPDATFVSADDTEPKPQPVPELAPPDEVADPKPMSEPLALPEAVRVNLTELAARIAGYHDGLDEVEMALLTMDSPGLESLSRQVELVNELTGDFQFVQLYYDALTEGERQVLLPPRTMDAAVAELQRQLRRLENPQDGDFLSTVDATQQDRIAELREQLATIAERTAR